MVAVTEGAVGRFDMGRVVQRTFGVLGRNFGTFLGLAVVLAGVPQGLFYGGMAAFGFEGDGGDIAWGAFGAVFVGLIGMLIGGLILQAGLTHATVADLNGKRISAGAVLSTGGRFILPLLGLGVLMTLAITAGLLLLIVPGVIMSLAWCVAAPVLVVERRGVMESFGRSADLTRGHRGAIFGLSVAYTIVSWIFGALVGGIVAVTFLVLPEAYQAYGQGIGQAVGGLFTTLVGTAGVAAVYYELRAAKEGLGAEALASVFD